MKFSAASMPVVRNRAVIHMMDWCKSNTEQLCDDTFFQDIHDLVILSITDVWSAIRNACASRLGPVAANLSLENVQTLFNSLVKVTSPIKSIYLYQSIKESDSCFSKRL